MEKRVFIIHGWGGSPKEGWFPWLKKELEKKGFKVFLLSMPNTNKPKIETWVTALARAVKKADKDTHFVGHSIGCQTILRYLGALPQDVKVGNVILAAPWISLTSEVTSNKNDYEIAKPWIEIPINWKKIFPHAKRFVAIFSDNDPFVSSENSSIFRKKLGAKIIFKHNMGHFSGIDKIKELPVVLEELS